MRFFLLLFFSANLVFATEQKADVFSGRFSGPGTALMHKSGNKRTCSEIFLALEQKEKEFRLFQGGYNCEDLKAQYAPFTLAIREGKVWDGAEEVGTITEDTFILQYYDKEEDYSFRLRLKRNASGLEYLEEWMSEGTPALTISGALDALP